MQAPRYDPLVDGPHAKTLSDELTEGNDAVLTSRQHSDNAIRSSTTRPTGRFPTA